MKGWFSRPCVHKSRAVRRTLSYVTPESTFGEVKKENRLHPIIPPIHHLFLLPSSSPLPSLAVVAAGEPSIDETSFTSFIKHVVLRSLKSCTFHWYVVRQGQKGRVIGLIYFVDRRKFAGQGTSWPRKRLCSGPWRSYSHHQGRYRAYIHLLVDQSGRRGSGTLFSTLCSTRADSFFVHSQVLIANNGIVCFIGHDTHILRFLQRYRCRQGNPLHSSMELRSFWNG